MEQFELQMLVSQLWNSYSDRKIHCMTSEFHSKLHEKTDIALIARYRFRMLFTLLFTCHAVKFLESHRSTGRHWRMLLRFNARETIAKYCQKSSDYYISPECLYKYDVSRMLHNFSNSTGSDCHTITSFPVNKWRLELLRGKTPAPPDVNRTWRIWIDHGRLFALRRGKFRSNFEPCGSKSSFFSNFVWIPYS